MVVIDATMFMLFLQPNARVPAGPDGVEIRHARERVLGLIEEMEEAQVKVAIPTPALAEVLVRVGANKSEEIVDLINRHFTLRLEPFDARAAIEVAAMTRAALEEKRSKSDDQSTWAKVKYDRQIVAIAKVVGATAIYSDDAGVRAIASRLGIQVIGLADLPVPEGKQQLELGEEGGLL